MKTIFEKIIDREIPADIIYESETSLAFLDINPVTKGHLLLITKNPYPWMTDVPSDEIVTIFTEAQNLMKVLKESLNCDYVQLGVVGKDVPHFHIHLIPRFIQPDDSDTPPEMRHHESYTDNDEKEFYITKIKNAL